MGKTSSEFDVDITIQKNAIKLNESDSRYFEKIGKTLEAIEKQQEKMTGEIKKVGENIKDVYKRQLHRSATIWPAAANI